MKTRASSSYTTSLPLARPGSTLGLAAAATQASAAALLSKQVSAASAVERSCTAGKLSSGSGYAQESVTMPSAGSVSARLTAGRGRLGPRGVRGRSGQVVAGSAYRGSRRAGLGLRDRRRAPGGAGLPAVRQRIDRLAERRVDRDRQRPAWSVPSSCASRPRTSSGATSSTGPRARRDRARRPRLRRRGAPRRRRRPEARREQLRLHRRDAGPRARRQAGPRGRLALRRGQRGQRVPQRRHQLPPAVRLQRGPQAPRARAPRPGAPDHPQPRDLRGPQVEGIEIATNPNAARRAAGLPSDGRAPRA